MELQVSKRILEVEICIIIHKFFRSVIIVIGLLASVSAKAVPTYFDSANCNIYQLFKAGKGRYVIRYIHQFDDTLHVPRGCELFFRGGSLIGPVMFNNTKLSGSVNLRGAHVCGNVKNKIIDASWFCVKDGVNDDAPVINEILSVCKRIFFPRGTYRLISAYNQENFHIGIRQSHVLLTGEKETVFLTKEQLGHVCVFSKPSDITSSVKDICIKGITFRTVNDGSVFLEWTHAIQTKGVNNLTIENCTIEDFWGDGICLNHYGDTPETGERSRNQNVRILNNVIIGGKLHNNRNGISIINGKNVLIQGNTICNTSRHDMPGAIDVEPNNSAYTIEYIRIKNNVIKGSHGCNAAISVCMSNGGPGRYIYVEDNTISNSNLGICVIIKTEDTTEDFIIRNNYVAADTSPYKFVGEGRSKNWMISGNVFAQPTQEVVPGNLHIEKLKVRF